MNLTKSELPYTATMIVLDIAAPIQVFNFRMAHYS